jgi:hypothetical protein
MKIIAPDQRLAEKGGAKILIVSPIVRGLQMANENRARPFTFNLTPVFDQSFAALLAARATRERPAPKGVAAGPEPLRRRSNRKYWPHFQPEDAT